MDSKSVESVAKENREFYQNRTVYIFPLPKNTSLRDELEWFLFQFGSVRRYHYGKKETSLIVEYYDSGPVEILTKKLSWQWADEYLYIMKMTNEDQKNSKKAKDPKKVKTKTSDLQLNPDVENGSIHQNLIKELHNEMPFNEQLTILLKKTELDADDMERYDIVCPHIQAIFKSIFPDCQTFQFGSTITGLSMKGCDLDIYMYVGKIMPPISNESRVSVEQLSNFVFKKVRKLMYSLQNIFTDIVPIPKAKTPIIKFRYLPTNISCDLTFKNGLGIYKCNFLNYCTFRDYRIRPLMMLIKYWAKLHNLSGTGKISNYALTCLVIFYLQQESVNLLPCFMDLQKNCRPLMITGWQVNFNKQFPSLPSTSKLSIPQLLHGFFSFYASFDFRENIVCLLDGKTHSYRIFANTALLPDSTWHVYKTCVMENKAPPLDYSKVMVVQDPIELNQNTAAMTSARILKTFQRNCEICADICMIASTSNYNNLLKTLFVSICSQIRSIDDSSILNEKKGIYEMYLLADPKCNFIKVVDEFCGHPRVFEEFVISREYASWFYVVCYLLNNILKLVFKLNVQIFLKGANGKTYACFGHLTKIVTDLSVFTFPNEGEYTNKAVFCCEGKQCVWKNRPDNIGSSLDVQQDALEKEIIVSDKMLEQLSEEDDESSTNLNFTCEMYVIETHGTRVRIKPSTDTLATSQQKQLFKSFCEFVRTFIPVVMTETWNHMQKFKEKYNDILRYTLYK